MKPKFHLTRFTDYRRVRLIGKSYADPLVVLIAAPNDSSTVRIGVSASNKIGTAVKRNKAKRRIRSCLYDLLPSLKEGWDLVLRARKPICDSSYLEIFNAITNVLYQANLLERNNGY